MIVAKTGEKDDFEPGSNTDKEAWEVFYTTSGLDETFPFEIESVSYWTVAALNSERYSSEKWPSIPCGRCGTRNAANGWNGRQYRYQVISSSVLRLKTKLIHDRTPITWHGNLRT